MHTYRKVGDKWLVGFRREGAVVRFEDIRSFNSEEDAASFASWLNGGATPLEGFREAYLNGQVTTIDTDLHPLLVKSAPYWAALKGCQIANRSTSKDCIVTFYDGNSMDKPLGFVGCPSLDARSYTFDPPLISASDIYCASADALTTIYVAAQGYKISAPEPILVPLRVESTLKSPASEQPEPAKGEYPPGHPAPGDLGSVPT